MLNKPRDAYVIDMDDAQLTKSDIAQLHAKGSKVISYISIGEIHPSRTNPPWNFNPAWITKLSTPTDAGCIYLINRQIAPSWLYGENCAWNSLKVKFWDPVWQQMVFTNVKKIAEAGYDGAYMDIVDAYYYFLVEVPDADKRSTSIQDMIQFVSRIRQEARSVNPNFLIVPQNAVDLYEYPEYRAVIDGFGVESTWYADDNLQDPVDQTGYVLQFLDHAIADGKFVLSIDYPTVLAKQCDFLAKARQHKFAPTIGPRPLDRIMDYPNCG